MPKEHQGHLLQNICEASNGIRSNSMGSTHDRQHQKGRSCPKESRQICDRRLSLHQQRHWHDREPFLGNTPAQKTAGKSNNDVPYRTCHGSYTSLSTPPATRCCNKRRPVQVQSPIQQDSKTKTYKESFFPISIRLWNKLPEELTTAESLETFKARIPAATQP